MVDKSVEKRDLFLIISVMVVVFSGILTLYTQEANFSDGSGRWYRQLIYFFIGFLSMWFMSRTNYQLLGSYAIAIYTFSIFLLAITLVPFIGYLPQGRGARSWLKIGPVALQASELAKLSTVILLGQYLVIKERDMKSIPTLIVPFLIVLLPMLLIILQPDFGTAVSFLPILFTMLYLGGADAYHIFSLVGLGAISLLIPMYLEFTKLTLIGPLTELLRKEQKIELLSLVNQAGGKIWALLEGKSSPLKNIAAFNDPKTLQSLREAVDVTIEDNTSFLFRLLYNEAFLLTIGIIFVSIAFVMILMRIARGLKDLRSYYIPIGIFGLSFLLAVTVNKTIPFRENQVVRLTAFVNPDQFKQGAGYQLRASKPAVGSGQIFGKGFFHGEMTEGKTPHVPEAGTDFIFSSWAEQTGFVGSLLLLFFLFSIPLRGLQVSFESKDRFGSLLASGIVALIFFHIAINIGIVIGLLPITGLPLSFMSYGGSHLVMVMTAVGIILSIKMRKFAN